MSKKGEYFSEEEQAFIAAGVIFCLTSAIIFFVLSCIGIAIVIFLFFPYCNWNNDIMGCDYSASLGKQIAYAMLMSIVIFILGVLVLLAIGVLLFVVLAIPVACVISGIFLCGNGIYWIMKKYVTIEINFNS